MVIPTGLIGSEQALGEGLGNALAVLQGVGEQGNINLNDKLAQITARTAAISPNSPQAANLLAAFSGAAGQGAQQQAFQDFQLSPAAKFLQEQGEKALLRTASARGGLGGGNIQKDILRFNQGLSSQELANQLGQLNQLVDRRANLVGLDANAIMNTGALQTGLFRDLGSRGANFQFNTGLNRAAGRTRVGEQLANNINSTSSALANLQNQQGQGVAGAIGSTTGNLANLLSGLGQNQAQQVTQLITLLANLSQGQGSQLTGLPGIPGVQQTPGALEGLGSLAGGLGGLIGAL